VFSGARFGTQAEGLQYVGQQIHEEISGTEMPATVYTESPEGERWEEGELAKVMPKLYEKFG